MKEYLHSIEQTFEKTASTPDGLTSQEVLKRQESSGKNKLREAKKDSFFKRFFKQLADPMIIILLVAAVISAATSIYEGLHAGEGFVFPSESLIILIVVLLNSTLGVIQESKAEKAVEALQEISATTSKVLRDGKITVIRSEDLVVGDIIVLEAGDAIPADARIIECVSMKVEESALTGESVPVTKTTDALNLNGQKDISLGDRKNMVYMGSTLVYGRGKAVICAIGMDTEMGKIADALEKAEEGKTPLQMKLSQLSKILTYLVLGISVFIFLFSIVRNWIMAQPINGPFVLNTFMIAVSLAVAAIPEGLVAVVTIVLSIGVTNMSKRNAIIRKLTAVETLGCAQIICSDKTGTLTQNKMTVVDKSGEDVTLLAKAMALCSDAYLDENNKATGEPTECALVNYAVTLGLRKHELEKITPRVAEAPFDSMRKMMSTVHQTEKGFIQYTKGAPDEVLKKCTSALIGGKEVPLTEAIKNDILAENKRMADKALRVLGAAYKTYSQKPSSNEPQALEYDLCYIGLEGMIDPVRPEVIGAIKECRTAGIRPIMITGDHRDTAIAIALQLGIISSEEETITGMQLDDISDEQLKVDIVKYSVYARVQPEHKVRIVNAWKAQDKVVAMTGDGVNDAPSIKSADIGVGMGITGTDVTKNVADMVLADDNFATIVSAIGEGRRIYDNIRKAIQFLLASNLSEVLSIFAATVLGFTILKPVHLLWINLITDSLPALALGVEEPEIDIMNRKPREAREGVFANGVGFDCLWQGVMVTVLTLLAFFIGEKIQNGAWAIADSTDGMTMAFLTLSMAEIFHSFNMRSRRKSIFSLKKQNWFLIGAAALALGLTTMVIYVDFLSLAFGFVSETGAPIHISVLEYAVAMALAFAVIPITEIVKMFQRAADKKFQLKSLS